MAFLPQKALTKIVFATTFTLCHQICVMLTQFFEVFLVDSESMKNDFAQFVTSDSVMLLTGKNKLEVMDQLISRAADLTKLDRDMIFRLIWKREQMMTTGVGGQLALPHIRVNDILHPFVIVGVCENAISDYQGQDDQPVRVIVFTVAPDENQEAYLQLLSSISRRFRNPELISALTEVESTDQIFALVQQGE